MAGARSKITSPDLQNGASSISSDNSEKKKNPDEMHIVFKQIGFHPEYLNEFLNTTKFLMYGDGPLPHDYRHYIAIMAASRHQCHPLVNYHKKLFLACNGDINWLRGLQYCPMKLRKLGQINTILAHTPWLLQKCHLTRLNKNRHFWAAGELCQAMVLLSHFHCFCSFVFASQILDFSEDFDLESDGASWPDPYEEFQTGQDTVEELMEKMSLIQQRETGDANLYDLPANHCDRMDECPTITIEPEQRKPFYIHDCSWDYHAYSILNRYYNDVGSILDAKFKVAYDLTYYTMGHKQNVDTTIFRRAVWNYIHRIYGIIHEDYNYAEMEELLEDGFRSYIETVVFCPEKITKDAHDIIMRAFRHSEKVHINLMLFEARMQSELLYALSIIMKYMAS